MSASVDRDDDEFMAANPPTQTSNKFSRPSGISASHSSRFSFKEQKSFSKQYAAIYFTRLSMLSHHAKENARQQLTQPAYASYARADGTPPVLCERLLDMSPDDYCVITGTVYKEMKLKPCILDEYNKKAGGAVGAPTPLTGADGEEVHNYMSEADTIILEDQFGRVALTGTPDKLPVSKLVSGLVGSVLGKEASGGKFAVEAIFYPGLAPQKPLPSLPADAPPAYMLCVSGLSFGSARSGYDPTPVQLLMDYVSGLLGSSEEQKKSAHIVRVLIAGNSLQKPERRSGGGPKDLHREELDPSEITHPLQDLDVLLTQLAAAVPVDIMPGENDPSNFTLPQQPFHPCLFPSASTYSTFTSTTNPCLMEVNGLQVLATAGQNVADLRKYCDAPAPIDYMENCLHWRNVAPTAPDTLGQTSTDESQGCYPYQEQDPFVLDFSPHLYIVGSQPSFSSRLVRGEQGQMVRAISLPSFARTGVAVLVNVNSPTLETKAISFKVQSKQ